MKIKEGFTLRRVLDECVVIANGEASKTFHGMIKLNDSAASLWEWIEKGLSEAELCKALAEKYELAPEKARDDVKSMILQMTEAGIVEA